ncbi:MAG: alpha/beta hydrolase [Lachnospiraceae bacterium]|nr:alpha/beta hydrolase [Lachnospiraceae bacterium]
MEKRIKRHMIAAAGIAAGVATVKAAHQSLENLAETAMNRKLTEKNERRILSAGTPASTKEQEREDKKTRAAERLQNSEYSTVTINSQDGIRLTGHLHLVEESKRTVIAVHGWRSSWAKDFGMLADFLAANDEWKHVAESSLHYNYRPIEKYMDKAAVERIGFTSNEYSSTEAMRECKIPVLFIHGTNDTFVPIEMTYENYAACAAPKRLLIVPDAGHCQGYLTEPERYEKELLQFWQDFDGTIGHS